MTNLSTNFRAGRAAFLNFNKKSARTKKLFQVWLKVEEFCVWLQNLLCAQDPIVISCGSFGFWDFRGWLKMFNLKWITMTAVSISNFMAKKSLNTIYCNVLQFYAELDSAAVSVYLSQLTGYWRSFWQTWAEQFIFNEIVLHLFLIIVFCCYTNKQSTLPLQVAYK